MADTSLTKSNEGPSTNNPITVRPETPPNQTATSLDVHKTPKKPEPYKFRDAQNRRKDSDSEDSELSSSEEYVARRGARRRVEEIDPAIIPSLTKVQLRDHRLRVEETANIFQQFQQEIDTDDDDDNEYKGSSPANTIQWRFRTPAGYHYVDVSPSKAQFLRRNARRHAEDDENEDEDNTKDEPPIIPPFTSEQLRNHSSRSHQRSDDFYEDTDDDDDEDYEHFPRQDIPKITVTDWDLLSASVWKMCECCGYGIDDARCFRVKAAKARALEVQDSAGTKNGSGRMVVCGLNRAGDLVDGLLDMFSAL